MKFKMKNILGTIMCTLFIAFTACNDGKKEEEKMKMEAEKIEMEAQKKEAEMKKMEAEKKAMAIKNSIAGKAMATENLSTLVAALKAANLATMLSEPGNYTVFAPTDQAFSKLPEGTVDNLLKPENKVTLQSILQYHVVPGTITAKQLMEAIKTNNGKYSFKTVTGTELTAMMDKDQFVIKDSRGKTSQVIQGNVEASNGTIYIVNDVLMEKK